MERDQWVWDLEQVEDVVFVHPYQVMPLTVDIHMPLILMPVIRMVGTLTEVILTLVVIPMLLVQVVVDSPEGVAEVVHLEVVEAEVEDGGKNGCV